MKIYVVSRQMRYEVAENLAVFQTKDSACGFALDRPTLAGTFWTEYVKADYHTSQLGELIMAINNCGEFIIVEAFDMRS